MTPSTPNIDLVYREYVKALLRYQYAPEDEDAQQVEDVLDHLWEKLDVDQQRSVRGVSSDLNWIMRRGEPPPKGRDASDVTESKLADLADAQKTEDWHDILYQLRVCAPAIPPAVLAYSRATCYFKLDFPEIAIAATDLTVELSRGVSPVARFAFEALMRLAPGLAFERANRVISSAAEYPPVLVAQCVGYLFDFLGSDSSAVKTDSLAAVVRTAIPRLASSQPSVQDRVLFFQLAGAEMQAFGFREEAVKLYEAGLALDPVNPSILTGLGQAMYESNPDLAAKCFQAAVRQRAPFIRPYMHLSHYHLTRKEFADAYGYARQAVEFAGSDRARAAIIDIMAVSASELKFPSEKVLHLFEEAARLDPDSQRLQSNVAVYRGFLQGRASKADLHYQDDLTAFLGRETTLRTSMFEEAFAGSR